MNILRHILLAGGALLTMSLLGVSCTDENDWTVDPAYDRLFSVNSSTMSIDVGTNTVVLEWTNTPQTDYYLIEVSKDSLTDDVEMGASNGSIVFGEDKSVTSSPDTLKGLQADTKYFIRMMGVSDAGKKASKWTYPTKFSFTTDAEQLFKEAETVVAAKSVTVAWTSGEAVTRLVLKKDGANDSTDIALSAADKQAGKYTITGLIPQTDYVISIYNDKVKRGSLKVTTAMDLPEGYDVVTIKDAATLNDALTNPDKYVNGNNGNLLFLIAKGADIDYTDEAMQATIPASVKSVQFFGEPGGDIPTLSIKGFTFEGSHAQVRFYNLNLTSSGSGYIVNMDAAADIQELSVENCKVSNMGGVIRSKVADTQIGSVKIDNCLISNIGQYGIISNDKGGSLAKVSLTNSTVYGGAGMKGVVIVKSDIDIQVENCTFYDCLGDGRYFVDDNKKTVHLLLKNCILGKAKNIKATRTKGISDLTNVYVANDFEFNGSNNFDGQATLLENSSTDLFVDPDKGDFHIQKGLVTNAGDPRWLE